MGSSADAQRELVIARRRPRGAGPPGGPGAGAPRPAGVGGGWLLILVLMAVMWNALAGYGGLVSVGQQAYIGLGAYATVWLCNHSVNPYLAMVLATLFCGAVSIPLSFLLLRFRGAQFAIGTWVVAEALAIYVSFDNALGAGTGTSLKRRWTLPRRARVSTTPTG